MFLLATSPATFAQNIIHAELLGRPTNHSITVQCFFDDSVEACVEYGIVPGVYPNQTTWEPFADSMPAEILIDNLLPDTKYYYRYKYKSPGNGNVFIRPEYSFHTQRAVSSSFSFVVQADPHLDTMSDTALYRLCLNNQLDDEPDFMIDLGDFLMSDKLKNASNVVPRDTIPYRCHLLRSYYETETHSVPLFIALGNHEGETGWYQNGTANNVAVWGTTDRKKYFLNPVPDGFYTGDTINHNFVGLRENYYSWQWGDALFIVIDPYWYTSPKPDSLTGWRWTLGQTQYEWLKSTLENSTATYKFVFSHQLVGGDPDGRGGVEFADRYEWGGANLDGTNGWAANRPGWAKPIKDLLTDNRVTIFFHGHDHFFGKQEKDCLIYQETPQPSLPNFQNANQAATYGYLQGQILPNAGHLRVNVSATGVQVDYVRAYLPQNENANRHNKDVSASYFIGPINCYDSLNTGVPVIWNANYDDELIYPNPFKEETKIHFSVAQSEKIDLSIVDQNGKVVRRLLTGNQIAQGKFEIFWDGKDGNGKAVTSGTYFYLLNGEHSGVKRGKIVLLGN